MVTNQPWNFTDLTQRFISHSHKVLWDGSCQTTLLDRSPLSDELRDPGSLHCALPSQVLCFQLRQQQRVSAWKIMKAIGWARPGSGSYQSHPHSIGQNKTTWPHLAKRKAKGKYRRAHGYWRTISSTIELCFWCNSLNTWNKASSWIYYSFNTFHTLSLYVTPSLNYSHDVLPYLC